MKKYMTITDLCKRGLLLAGLALVGLTAQAQTYEQYVKSNGAFSNDGTSWATAKNNVQEALNMCQKMLDGGGYDDAVVYVAAGTYKPTEATEGGNTAQYQAFKIYGGITVKGGYDKDGEPDATQKPVFDGSLDAQLTTKFFWNDKKQRFDTEFPNNSYHVVTFATNGFATNGHANALPKSAVLENIIIEHGRAYSTDVDAPYHHYANGGGVYMVEGATLRNCEVRYCVASRDGGGVYMDGGGTIEQCDIHHNQALGQGVVYGMGGGVAASNGGTIARTYIYNNVGRMGGGLALKGGAAALFSLVANNSSTTEAGGVYVEAGATLNSMSVYRNRCNGSGARIDGVVTGRSAGVYCTEGGKVYNSAIWGNSIGATNGETLGDMQFYAFSKGSAQTTLVNVALSNSDRVNWSFASTSGLVPLASADDIKLTKVTATTGVLDGTDVKSDFDAKPQAGSLLIGKGLQNVTLAVAVSEDLVGEPVSPVCDLGAVMAKASTQITGYEPGDGSYVLFVDPNAASNEEVVTGEGGYGASWANPLSNLNDALSHMSGKRKDVFSGNLIIYVKEGTIIPANSESSSLRGATLQMVSGCTVEGGYPTELSGTNLTETKNGGTLKRNPLAYPTIVTGSFGSSDYANNIAHLVTFNGVNNAVFDGFQLRYGNATGDGNQNGAGIYAYGGSGNKVMNTVVSGCTAAQGAALYVGNAGQMEVVNTIFRNNAVTGTLNTAAIVAAGGGSTLKLTHCDVISNVGNGLYESGSNVTVEYSVFYANLNKALDNSNNWVDNAKLCAPIIKNGGELTVTQSLFDSQWANQTDKLVSQSYTIASAEVDAAMCVLSCNPADVAAYPQFKDATRNVGVSPDGDITFYGNAADFTPSNMNPMTNGATGTLMNTYDMVGNLRSFGGSADIGALENVTTQPEVELAKDANGNYLNQIAFTPVLYVRDYHSYDAEGNRTATDFSTTSPDGIFRDGTSWAKAINGNAFYRYAKKEIIDVPNENITAAGNLTTYSNVASATAADAVNYIINRQGHYIYATDENMLKFNITDQAAADKFAFLSTGTNGEYYIYDVTVGKYVYWTQNRKQEKDGVKLNATLGSTNNYRWNLVAGDGGFAIRPKGYNNSFGWNQWGGSGEDNNIGIYNENQIYVITKLGTRTLGGEKDGMINGLQYAVNMMHDGLGLNMKARTESKNENGKSNTLSYFDLPTGRQDGQVWVGAGIYTKPDGYAIRNHVKVYGGFPKVGNPGMKERHPQLTSGVAMSDENQVLKLNYLDYETILQTRSSKIDRLPNVIASAKLVSGMFRRWNGSGANASVTNTAVTPTNYIGNGNSYNNGQILYGDGNVYYLNYADLTGFASMTIRGVGQVRLVFNRRTDNGTDFIEKIITINERGVDFDLSEVATNGFVHLNAIKVPQGFNGTRIDQIMLNSKTDVSEMTDYTIDFDAMTTIVTADDGNKFGYFSGTDNKIKAGSFSGQGNNNANYYFMKFAQVADASNCDYSKGNIYTIQMLNKEGERFGQGQGFLNVQSLNGDRNGYNKGSIIFAGGYGSNYTDYGQDRNNFALWRVVYISNKGFALQNVGRDAEGSDSYLDPATGNMVKNPVIVRIFTQGVSVLSHPAECRPTIGYDDNTYQSRVIYEGSEWDGFTMRNGYKNGIIGRNNKGGRRNGGAGASIYENFILRNCVIRDNYIGGSSAIGRGAGIYVDGGSILNCYVMNNVSNCLANGSENFGGGIYMITGTLYNTVITHNYLKQHTGGCHGAGIFMESASFYNNTIVNNYGGSAIGVYTSSTTEAAKLDVYNTIVIACPVATIDGVSYPAENIMWRASNSTPAKFINCYLQHTVSDLNNGTQSDGTNYVISNSIFGYKDWSKRNEFGPFVQIYDEAVRNYDYRITAKGKRQVPDTQYNNNCVNAGTEDIGKDYLNRKAKLPEIDMDYTDRIQDCRVDIGAYEFNGASMIAPTLSTDGKVATYYVSENGRTSTAATSPAEAACWQKIQKVLDAAGRYKFANPGVQVIVKLAGEETPGAKTMKDLYDDPERGEQKGGTFAFKYSPRNTTNLSSDDMRDYSLMIPRGVEVWGGYYVSNNTDKMAPAPEKGEFLEAENDYNGTGNLRSVTGHPTVLDGRYESSDRTQYVYAYHTLTFTDQVFDANHKPYLENDVVANDKSSTYKEEESGNYTTGSYASLASKTNDRAVVDGLFITGGRANKPEDNASTTTVTKSYGGAAVLTDFAHIRNCIVEDNKALNGGGAFLLQPGSLISGTLLKKNEAKDGGAIYFQESDEDNPVFDNMAQVITTTIVDNTATGEGGGAWFTNNARFNSTVLWGNHCSNQKNIYGASPEYGGAKFAYYYTAVENMRVPGINNLNVSSVPDQGVRFEEITYYGLDIYSALVNTGTLANEYEKLDGETANDSTYLALAKKDFMGRERVHSDYDYITIGARAQFLPDYGGLITRLYVDPNQSADIEYMDEEDDEDNEGTKKIVDGVRYFESLTYDNNDNNIYSQRGSSNGFPMQSLQEAIDYINLKRGNGKANIDTEFQIILADGEYWPSRSLTDDPYEPTSFTFNIPDNVKIIGGVVNTLRKDGEFLGQDPTFFNNNNCTGDDLVAQLPLENLIEMREGLRTFDENQNNVIEPWEFAKESFISGNVVNSEQDKTNSQYVMTINAKTQKGIYLNGVIVGEGKADQGSNDKNGGALNINTTSVPVTINQSQFLDNHAELGGAIQNKSTLNIYNSFFAKNVAKTGGGAISSTGNLFVTNTLFANNETAGDGGAIYSGKAGKNSTLRIVNSDVVMNKAANWPAIYTEGNANNQVLNSVFWGNVASGSNKAIIPKADGSVRFTAYEAGCGPEVSLNKDERAKEAGAITNGLVGIASLSQNSNIIISSNNDDLDGPNFGNPTRKAGAEGFTPDADFMPYRENRLVDAGWGWVEQDAAGTAYATADADKDGAIKGGAYALVSDEANNAKVKSVELAIGGDDYILLTMHRISLNPSPGAGTKAFIDLGVYELTKVSLKPAGICIDELWVSTEEKRDNGVADGSSWLQPTTNVQDAINTLLSSRCGHHKVLHVMEGEYNPLDYNGTMAYVINTGSLNEISNIDGYENHLNGTTLEVKDENDNVIATYNFDSSAEAKADAIPGVASLTIIGGYSKNISEMVDVVEERSGETKKDVRQGVRNGEQYPTLLTSKFANTTHVIDIEDARQWYGHGHVEAVPAYNGMLPRLSFKGEDPTVVPIVIEGIMVKNALANNEGLAVNYVAPTYQRGTNDQKQGSNYIIYTNDQTPDGKTYYAVPAIVNGIEMPKLTISHDILYGNGSNTNSSALYIGQGGGQSLVLNSLFHSNAGNSIDAYDTKIVNSTIALNGGKVVLHDSDPANKVNTLFGSLLWRNAAGEYVGVSDLQWNAISGFGSDDDNHNTLLDDNNSDIAVGPNFIDPENANVDKRNFHLQASQKTLNIIENGLYDAALGANSMVVPDWFHAKLISPYVAQDLAFVSRYLPSAVERGAYEYQQDGSRVLYYKPGGENKRDNDGLSWDKAFGQGNLQGAINLAALYNVSHPGEQAYVYAKTGDTHETITLVKGVSVIGGVSSTFNENVENGEDQEGKKVISDDQAEAYETVVLQTRPGVAAPGSNSTTVVDGIKATGTFNEPAIVDGVEVKGDLVIRPTEVLNDGDKNTGAIVIRNTIIDAPEGATSQRLEVDNALIYNVLLRNNLVNLTLGDNAYAAHVTSDKDFTGNDVGSRTYYNNMNYPGGAYKWNAYPNINYQLDETDDARINTADTYEQSKDAAYPRMPANLQAYINVDIDRDILGNPRQLGDKTDFGCYEMWRITLDEDIHANYESEIIYNKNNTGAPTTASKVWRNFPHVGSDVYIMGNANFILDETLIGLNNRDSRVENYNMKPGFLLVKEGGSLYGQGNVVNASYVASEQTLRAEGNLVALPYRHNYKGIDGREEGNYPGDNGTEMAKYNGDERAAWKYNSNWFATVGSKCWEAADADEEIPAFQGVYFKGETGAPHRFTSKGTDFFNDNLYTENGASKNVTLTQHNNLKRGNNPIADGELTAKEDMGWNLFGIPYLVSHYKPYEKPADRDYYMMQLPKELWLYFNGTSDPDGTNEMLNGAGFYQVASWDAATWHQAPTDTPRLWHGEGFFAQTATIHDKEQIVFQFPRYEGTASSAPQTRAGLEGNTRFYAVEDFETEPEENNLYFDLNGRRVQNPQAGRIYIVNGKKVIM